MERLNNEEIEQLDEFLKPFETGGDSGADLTRRALKELLERRAADISHEDIETLLFARAVLSGGANFMEHQRHDPIVADHLKRCDAVVKVIDKIIGSVREKSI